MPHQTLRRLFPLLGIVGLTLGCGFFQSLTVPAVTPLTIPSEAIPLPPQETAVLQSVEPPAEATLPPTDAELEIDYLYTSELITIIYPLYGNILDDFTIVTITNTGQAAAQLLVLSEISGYTDPAIDTVFVDPGAALEIRQNPRLIPERIDALNVDKPAQFHLRIASLDEGGEQTLFEQTHELRVFARRDFPWSIQGFEPAEVYDLLAAMVMPNDPAVEELIRTAADYTSDGMMWSGYGGNLNDEGGGVWERLEAIWEAETRNYELTYISTWVSYAPGDVQRIRLPAEVLEQRSGNCIELALLYASAAEALDLETAIILVPGHAYMAVRTDMENADYYFIETTLIGRTDFNTAVERGKEEFDEALPHLEAGDDYYGWVTIQDAREKGILPLPWR